MPRIVVLVLVLLVMVLVQIQALGLLLLLLFPSPRRQAVLTKEPKSIREPVTRRRGMRLTTTFLR
jgi:hypothetical protein